ncbi:MAG: fluoride efflux transporter CrcB [Bacteroidia bacterium]|nr:fluoride efflux transporter CrcB [Bacteroidia bacterium]MDW8302810.1 fluoride efflux transporter CrcB [Bacteroidia bacterium]
MLKNVLLVFLGGGVGSAVRYLIHVFVHSSFVSFFPVWTFLANLIASFLVGIWIEKVNVQTLSVEYRYLLITGFCGGLSTFSTFSYENVHFLTEKQILLSALYTLLSVVFCFTSTLLGTWIAERI